MIGHMEARGIEARQLPMPGQHRPDGTERFLALAASILPVIDDARP
ncbi:hypothetical protein HN371_25620 [Candidatus Poribacteria bacterium]|jgi:hypothetical protein|nr:hypothetical protein [Candidatus Poribacteria bacterium]MBT5535862.1 hypothetical protein [Candidatus Poribacteria bacterium]MBT5710707.1 hypothetical protein [Candidatus Poribacteria bacterium]MBT7098742.1 hypothetical protein [Candidatus Poribacteria bacterium]MBT7806412.1 hypothetical protein [Candidatus Poribacteria bacterium]